MNTKEHEDPSDDLPNILVPCSLRDWFAGMALQGLLACPEVNGGPEDLPKVALQYADAMLKERQK